MYRHLLVPVDGTDLSLATAAHAATLAQALGARVTFLCAAPDIGSTPDGALMYTLDPAKFKEFKESARSHSERILGQVAESAKSKGVQHDTVTTVSDHPYDVIIETAKQRGCDLIFMASHGLRGLRGLINGSQTLEVVKHSPIPVLVAAVENNAGK